ncbi:MAG: Na/Pi cotransporter family protein [Clostridia bacterium]|nr:Na/Pi cotransporter family protein [Clostridia bacterium]
MDFWMIVSLLGGLALFLYGMNIMSAGLESMTGDKLRDVLAKLTSNRFAAVGVGAGVTAVIQSSSATSVMVVGFVNAGLMTLAQAINVCMGANIGTTVTAQIVAFNVTQYSPLILFAGVLMMFFSKKRSVRRAGEIVGGLGLIFFGMMTMSDAMAPLRDDPQFVAMVSSFRNPWIGIGVGVLVTAVLQSSSAMMGIIQAFAMQSVLGLDTAVFLILGLNIGACVTPILAALGGTKTAMRAAIGILTFNIIGAFVFLVMAETMPLVPWVESWTPGEPVRQLANFHTLFNGLTTVIFLCFPKVLPWIAMHVIPGEDKRVEGRKLVYLVSPLPDSPTLVVGLAAKETTRMLTIAAKNFKDAVTSFIERNEELAGEVHEGEDTINYLNHAITAELTRVSGADLPMKDQQMVTQLLHTVLNVERISDIAENISELTVALKDRKGKLGKKAMAEMETMFKRVNESLDNVIVYLADGNTHAADMAIACEAEVDALEKRTKKNVVKRLKRGEVTSSVATLFTDCISMMERVADHSANIAMVFLKGDV